MRQMGLGLLVGTTLLSVWATGWADGGLVGRIGASGEYVELSRHADGQAVVGSLPLHRAGHIRYFSAGVGLEERSAEYPHFPLKIVFTAGGKPFLAGVSITIIPEKGGPALTIPQEEVEGPWLFVDLPPGAYRIAGTHGGQKQELKQIAVEAGKQKTVYLRWREDRGLAAPLPAE
jgi:hypothetical protein